MAENFDWGYLIYQDPSTGQICARSGKDGSVNCGTDATTVINNAINNLTVGRTWKERVVLKGNFNLSNYLSIPSYTILDIQGVLRNNSSRNMIRSNPFQIDPAIQPRGSGSKEIEIRGGKLDGNGVNQHLVQLTGVDGLTISDISCKNSFTGSSSHMAMVVNHSQNIFINNIYVDFSAPVFSSGGDGVHLVDSSFASINGVYGKSVDDLVALTNYKLDMSNITVSNIYGRSQYSSGFIMTDADLSIPGKTISDVTATNIITDMTDTPNGVYCIEIYTSKGGVIKNVNLSDIRGLKQPNIGIVMSASNGTISGINLSNFIISDTTNSYGIRVKNVSNINLNNGYVYNTSADRIGIIVESGNNVTINGVNSDVTSYAFQIGASSTINNLRMINCFAKGSTGIELRGNLNDAIIVNNDITKSAIKINKSSSFVPTDVIIKDNLGS